MSLTTKIRSAMRTFNLGLAASLLLATGSAAVGASSPAILVGALVDAQAPQIEKAALQVWDLAEVGYQEVESSRVLQEQLQRAGFKVDKGVAGMPTAFIASWSRGKGPVIGLLAEFDALPGLSQAATPVRKPRPDRQAAHACGHNLFGAASVGAAIALKQWLDTNRVQGEIRVFGTPAEEGGSGKEIGRAHV